MFSIRSRKYFGARGSEHWLQVLPLLSESRTCRFCPRPCVEHQSVSQAFHSPTPRETCIVQFVLWPCCYRMCVIAKETGQSPLARTRSKTWTFLKRLHVKARRLLCRRPLTSETSISKLAIIFPETAVLRTPCSACLTPRLAQDMWLGISNYYFFLFGKLGIRSASVINTFS